MTNRHALTGVLLLAWLAACSSEPNAEKQLSGGAALSHDPHELSNAPLRLTYFRLAK